MGAKNTSTVLRRLLVVAAAAIVVGLIWLMFRFVVSDTRLLLDYLRVLVWPLVVVAVLSFFRGPVEEKVRQLLRLDAFGASAEFSAEAQGRRLERDLEGDLTNLLGGIEPTEDERPSHDDESSEDTVHEEGAQTEATSGSVSSSDYVPTDEPSTVDGKEGGSTSSGRNVDLDDYLAVARALGVPNVLLQQYQQRAESDPERAKQSLTGQVLAEAKRARMLRNQAAHRPQETRESIEAVIRKSAAWGYDMGRAGAPEAVPDIEWNADGTWRITTEVPKQRPKRTVAADPEPRHLRQVKALEDEIKDLERKRHSPFGVGIASLGDEGWLDELKRRLSRVDPGNPWTL